MMYIAGSLIVFWEPSLHDHPYCLSKSRYHSDRWLQRCSRHQRRYYLWNAERPMGHLTGQMASWAIQMNHSKCGKLFSTCPPWWCAPDGKHSLDLFLSIFVFFWGCPRGHSRGELGINLYGSFGSDHGNLHIGIMFHFSSWQTVLGHCKGTWMSI